MHKLKILTVLAFLPLTACYNTSEGEMAGQITYFTNRGYFCRTWEGQIIMGGMRREYQTNLSSDGKSTTTTSSMIANTSKFTVENLTLVSKIQEAFRLGKPVVLRYKIELITFCRSDGDDVFIQSVDYAQ